jgi:hypothetical protein
MYLHPRIVVFYLKYDHNNDEGRSRKIMMTTFLPLTKTKTKRKNMKTKKVSLMFIATGVAQQKAVQQQKGFSLLEAEDFRIFIQRTAIDATIQALSNQCTN